MTQILFGLMTIFILVGCNPFAPALPDTPVDELPQQYSLFEHQAPAPDRWWQSFGDSQLDQLINQALAGNFSIQEAWARLKQARAVAVKSGALMYPDLFLEADGNVYRSQIDTGGSQTRLSGENYGLGFVSSYEIDLWGRIRSQQEADLLAAQAGRQELSTAAMTVAADIAKNWINSIAVKAQLRLLEQQLENNQTYLQLVDLRYRKAMVSSLDVYQQRQVVEQTRSLIPQYQEQESLLRHELALLLGKPPGSAVAVSPTDLPTLGPLPETGIPADLLAARPDIRSAGLRLHASRWRVAEARANRLPAIRLTAVAGYDSGGLEQLFDNWLLNLAGNLSAPLFDGGRRVAEVDRARAVADEYLIAYRRVVFTAVKEVEDALVRENKQRAHLEILAVQIDTARRALEEAGRRYLNGVQDYLPVLTQLLTLQRLEQDRIQRRADLLISRINLYRALGGGWADELVEPDELVAPS